MTARADTELAEMLRLCGLSQREACTLLDVPLSTLEKWSQGQRKTPPWVLNRMADLWADVSSRAGIETQLPAGPAQRRRALQQSRQRYLDPTAPRTQAQAAYLAATTPEQRRALAEAQVRSEDALAALTPRRVRYRYGRDVVAKLRDDFAGRRPTLADVTAWVRRLRATGEITDADVQPRMTL